MTVNLSLSQHFVLIATLIFSVYNCILSLLLWSVSITINPSTREPFAWASHSQRLIPIWLRIAPMAVGKNAYAGHKSSIIVLKKLLISLVVQIVSLQFHALEALLKNVLREFYFSGNVFVLNHAACYLSGATPKGILKAMGVPGLTIYHVKSHLQVLLLSSFINANRYKFLIIFLFCLLIVFSEVQDLKVHTRNRSK